jgi:hypothetical protein
MLTYQTLPDYHFLKQLKDNPLNTDQFKRHVEEYKEMIGQEMFEAYTSSDQSQEVINGIIESLITKVAELSATCFIMDNIFAQLPEIMEESANWRSNPGNQKK